MAFKGLRIRGDEATPDAEAHRARYRWAAEMLPPGSLVLDYGCGTGYGTKILKDAGHTVIGYDPDPDAIEYARGKYDVTCSECFTPHAGWDAIVCFEVLEHLKDPPLATYMMLESCAPIVIASVPYLEKDGTNPHHKWSRLQESTFPGRRIAYQYADGTITPMRGDAQNIIIASFPELP